MAHTDTSVVATSAITLTDLYDVRPIAAYIKANNTLGQVYNPANKTYNPDFSTSPLTLTAVVLDPVTHQESKNGVISVTWSYQIDDKFGQVVNTDPSKGWYLSGDNTQNLTLNSNFSLDESGATITAIVSYKDREKDTTATSTITAKIDFSNLVKSNIIINMYSPSGYNIVNGLPSKVSLSGDLYLNGTLDTSTKRKNDWFRQDTSVISKDNPLYDERAGLGWAKILSSTSNVKPNTDFGVDTTVNAILLVSPDDVINVESYKLLVTPTEGEHIGNYQTGFFTVYNFDSAFTISIQSPEGTIFKNGSGNKHLKATVYNAVGEVDSEGTKYNYYWYLYKGGELDPTFGGSGKKIGKTIVVNSSEIDDNSVLEVEIDI